MFYTYIYFINGIPKYVGKGSRDRWKSHRKSNSRLGRVLRKIYRLTDSWIIPTIIFHDTEQIALAEEIRLIREYGREDLCVGTLLNLTNGGDGSSGHKHSESHKKYMSEKQSGVKNPFYGKDHSQEIKRLLSDLHKGHKRGVGKKHTEEHRENISKSIGGDRNPACKVLVIDHPKIDAMYQSGMKQKDIADVFNISQSQISVILRRKMK